MSKIGQKKSRCTRSCALSQKSLDSPCYRPPQGCPKNVKNSVKNRSKNQSKISQKSVKKCQKPIKKKVVVPGHAHFLKSLSIAHAIGPPSGWYKSVPGCPKNVKKISKNQSKISQKSVKNRSKKSRCTRSCALFRKSLDSPCYRPPQKCPGVSKKCQKNVKKSVKNQSKISQKSVKNQSKISQKSVKNRSKSVKKKSLYQVMRTFQNVSR